MLLFVLGAGAVGWLAGESLRRGRQVGDSDRLSQYEPPRASWETLHTRVAPIPYWAPEAFEISKTREAFLRTWPFTHPQIKRALEAEHGKRFLPPPSEEIRRLMEAHPSKLRPRRTPPPAPPPPATPTPGRPMGIVPPYLRYGGGAGLPGIPGGMATGGGGAIPFTGV
jgi:hypothetical protein